MKSGVPGSEFPKALIDRKAHWRGNHLSNLRADSYKFGDILPQWVRSDGLQLVIGNGTALSADSSLSYKPDQRVTGFDQPGVAVGGVVQLVFAMMCPYDPNDPAQVDRRCSIDHDGQITWSAPKAVHFLDPDISAIFSSSH